MTWGSRFGLALIMLAASPPGRAFAVEQDPAACLAEIQTVCIHLEDELENCLRERGQKLSAPCREELQSAMAFAQDSTGPGICVPEVQRLCPALTGSILSQCITEKQIQFSDACRKYLAAGQSKRIHIPKNGGDL